MNDPYILYLHDIGFPTIIPPFFSIRGILSHQEKNLYRVGPLHFHIMDWFCRFAIG